MTISERHIDLGAEFVETLCYDPACHTCCGPKLLFKRFNGYGTKLDPPKEHIDHAYQEAKKHDKSHNIVVFIGHG